MKKTFTILAMASLVLTASCKKENAALRIDENTAKEAELSHANAGKMPVIKFEVMEHDFGTVNEGDKVEYTYKFTNEGSADLLLTNVKPACGCTVPEYTKTPIAPGQSGELKVTFDTAGKPGLQQKTVNVHTNTESGTDVISFKANVTPKA